MNNRRKVLLMCTAVLLALNTAIFWHRANTERPEADILVHMEAVIPCSFEASELDRVPFEKPAIWNSARQLWLHDGRAVTDLNEHARELYSSIPVGEVWDEHTRVRLSDDATFPEAMEAIRNLATHGVCTTAWADLTPQLHWDRTTSEYSSRRYDAVLELESLISANGERQYCHYNSSPQATPPTQKSWYGTPAYVPPGKPCVLPDLPVE